MRAAMLEAWQRTTAETELSSASATQRLATGAILDVLMTLPGDKVLVVGSTLHKHLHGLAARTLAGRSKCHLTVNVELAG